MIAERVLVMVVVVEKDGGSDGHVGSVYEYCREVLSLGLLYLYFKDSVRKEMGHV